MMLGKFLKRFSIALLLLTTGCAASTSSVSNEKTEKSEVIEIVKAFCDRYFIQKDATALSEYYAFHVKIYQKIGAGKELTDRESFQFARTNLFARLNSRGATYSTEIKEVLIHNGRAEATVEISLNNNNKFSNFTRYLSLLKMDGQWKVVRHSFDPYVPGAD